MSKIVSAETNHMRHGAKSAQDSARLAVVAIALFIVPLLMLGAIDMDWSDRKFGAVTALAAFSTVTALGAALAFAAGSFPERRETTARLFSSIVPEVLISGIVVVFIAWAIVGIDKPGLLDMPRTAILFIVSCAVLLPIYVVTLALMAQRRGVVLERLARGARSVTELLVPLPIDEIRQGLIPEIVAQLNTLASESGAKPHWAEGTVENVGQARRFTLVNLAAIGKNHFTTSEKIAAVELMLATVDDGGGITRVGYRLRGVGGRLAGIYGVLELVEHGQRLGHLMEQRIAALLTERELRWRNERLERLATQAELKAMQAQVEPHFLFNTLASLRRLIRSEPNAAEGMLDNLVTYLRNAMPDFRAQLSSVGRELRLAESYLAIMRVRIGGERLSYEVRCPTQIAEHPFPPAMLISLVENAVKHGLRQSERGGRIEVTVELSNDVVVARVQDNGVGVSTVSGTGVGLMNIRQRLESLYGARATLFAAARQSGGFESTITIPYGA